MKAIHSRGIVHRDLTPDNILLDWDWNVRIADFGQCSSPDEPPIERFAYDKNITSFDSCYLAPECGENKIVPENDVFSFGLILYELIVGEAVFPRSMTLVAIMSALAKGNWELRIPDCVLPKTRKLICDCLALKYRKRPSFSEILGRLEEMRFKLTPRVNSSKIAAFVERIKADEAAIDAQE
jgi:serine/threonine protein kinase